jgi:hypothetical protein
MITTINEFRNTLNEGIINTVKNYFSPKYPDMTKDNFKEYIDDIVGSHLNEFKDRLSRSVTKKEYDNKPPTKAGMLCRMLMNVNLNSFADYISEEFYSYFKDYMDNDQFLEYVKNKTFNIYFNVNNKYTKYQ